LRRLIKREVELAVKREVERVFPPEITVLLDDSSRGVRQVYRHLVETTAEGIDVPLPEVEVREVEYVDLKHMPLRSIDLFNKGPDQAYYRVNDDPREIMIENREFITISRPRRTIWRLTLRVDGGKLARVKLIGHY